MKTITALLLTCASAHATVQVTAPVRDFRLPVFTPSGVRSWDLRGSEGVRLPEGIVELRTMTLRFYDPALPAGSPALVTVVSPVARVVEAERSASGPDSISIAGPAYTISGKDWTFSGDAERRRITIAAEVSVVFKEQLDALLQ